MAITLDAQAGLIENGFQAGATETWNHTVATSATCLVVHVMLWQDVAGTGRISSMSYGGRPMTLKAAATGVQMRSELWYMIDPPVGTNAFSTTIEGSTDDRKFRSTSWNNVGSIGASNTATGTTGSPSVSVTTTRENSFVVDVVSKFGTTAATVGASQTSVMNDNTGSSNAMASYESKATPGAVSMDWAETSANDWSHCAMELCPLGPQVNTFKPTVTGSSTATVTGRVSTTGIRPYYIQGTQTANAASGGAINVSFGSNTVAGNLIVVATGVGSSTETVTITDSQGNSYSQANISTQASIPYRICVYYAIAGSSAANTVTMTPGANVANRRLLIHEYGGVDVFDATAQATAASGVASSGVAATTSAEELIFGWGINNTGTTVADPGFTLRQTALSESTVDQLGKTIGNYLVTYPTDATANACIMATFSKGSAVTERGVVYNTSGSPTTADSKVTDGTGVGNISCNLTGLSENTVYHARAYAINANTTNYGEEFDFIINTGKTGWLKA